MTGFNERRRYKCVSKRSDGKYFYEQNWSDEVQEASDWYREKKDAAKAWDEAHADVGEKEARVVPRRRGRPPKAEVVTGIVEE